MQARLLLILASLATAAFCHAQAKPERAKNLGYTSAQIAAMGHQKFSDIYDSKVGSSTADMMDGEISFAYALQVENYKKMPADKKATLVALETSMNTAGINAVSIAETEAGGGSMYNIFYASVQVTVQEHIAALLASKVSKTTEAQVIAAYGKAKKELAAMMKNPVIHSEPPKTVSMVVESTLALYKQAMAKMTGFTEVQKANMRQYFYKVFDDIASHQ